MSLPFIARALALLLLVSLGAANAEAGGRINRVIVLSETTDSVVLEVHYTYDGREGGRVFASAKMTDNGKALKHYGFRPGRVAPGDGRTQVTLSTNDRAPPLFASDGIRVQLYKGGGRAFLTQDYTYAKTWTRPRAALLPQLRIVGEVRPMRPSGGVLTVPGGGGGSSGAGGDAVAARFIRPGGEVEVRRVDGTRILLGEGSKTIIAPNGSEQIQMYSSAQPPTPPDGPPDFQHAAWVEAEAEHLLEIIRQLVGYDAPSIDAYLASEGDISVYSRVSERTVTIGKLVEP